MKQFNQDRMSHKMTVTRLLFLFAIIALLGGCATRPTYMIPTAFDTVKRHPQTVSVNVSGVFETDEEKRLRAGCVRVLTSLACVEKELREAAGGLVSSVNQEEPGWPSLSKTGRS